MQGEEGPELDVPGSRTGGDGERAMPGGPRVQRRGMRVLGAACCNAQGQGRARRAEAGAGGAKQSGVACSLWRARRKWRGPGRLRKWGEAAGQPGGYGAFNAGAEAWKGAQAQGPGPLCPALWPCPGPCSQCVAARVW